MEDTMVNLKKMIGSNFDIRNVGHVLNTKCEDLACITGEGGMGVYPQENFGKWRALWVNLRLFWSIVMGHNFVKEEGTHEVRHGRGCSFHHGHASAGTSRHDNFKDRNNFV